MEKTEGGEDGMAKGRTVIATKLKRSAIEVHWLNKCRVDKEVGEGQKSWLD
jgi:hypothetical protein